MPHTKSSTAKRSAENAAAVARAAAAAATAAKESGSGGGGQRYSSGQRGGTPVVSASQALPSQQSQQTSMPQVGASHWIHLRPNRVTVEEELGFEVLFIHAGAYYLLASGYSKAHILKVFVGRSWEGGWGGDHHWHAQESSAYLYSHFKHSRRLGHAQLPTDLSHSVIKCA